MAERDRQPRRGRDMREPREFKVPEFVERVVGINRVAKDITTTLAQYLQQSGDEG